MSRTDMALAFAAACLVTWAGLELWALALDVLAAWLY